MENNQQSPSDNPKKKEMKNSEKDNEFLEVNFKYLFSKT